INCVNLFSTLQFFSAYFYVGWKPCVKLKSVVFCVWEEYIVSLLIFIKKAVEVPVIPKKVCRLVPVIVKNNLI
ncbi:hypothetical protein DWZ34_02115, partial [Phocaeicola plebeius]